MLSSYTCTHTHISLLPARGRAKAGPAAPLLPPWSLQSAPLLSSPSHEQGKKELLPFSIACCPPPTVGSNSRCLVYKEKQFLMTSGLLPDTVNTYHVTQHLLFFPPANQFCRVAEVLSVSPLCYCCIFSIQHFYFGVFFNSNDCFSPQTCAKKSLCEELKSFPMFRIS